MHHLVDVQALDCDFYVSPGINCMAPPELAFFMSKKPVAGDAAVGRGRFYDRHRQPGEGTTWTKAPWRFEAGTPNTGASLVLARRWSMFRRWGLITSRV